MQRKRLIGTIAAGLGVLSLIPVATALGDDSEGGDGGYGQTVEAVTALGNTFTYQGRLTDGGSPANGTYDLRFILYDAESAGASVGSTLTKDNVTVTNGLFSVDLDFGTAVWNGDARWIEISVRPGADAGAFTVLSPRQPVSPTPYALYAKASGGFVVPFEATGTSAGAPSTPEGLVTIIQTGTGIGLAAQRTTTDSAQYPALFGTNAGGGAGVQGESTYADGVGVQGFAIGADGIAVAGTAIGADGTGGRFVGPTAIDINGALKVSGSTPAAFVHEVDTSGSGNTCGSDALTVIDNPLTNDDPDAILLLTARANEGTSAFAEFTLGVVYDSDACAEADDKWAIFLENSAGNAEFDTGDSINVLVIKQ